MSKRKLQSPDDLEMKERIRKKKLEDAKRFIERKGSTIREAARIFGIGRESLSIYLQSGFKKIGRHPLLDEKGTANLKEYLTALDSANLQQSILETGQIVQTLSGSSLKPSVNTVKKYVRETGLKIRKARAADEGRLRATESIEDFIHYYDTLEGSLDLIAHDPNRIFNVDEVGIQIAERSIRLITGHEYLNKNMNQTSIHVTLVLCTSPGQKGIFMPPHFLFQHNESSEPRNYLCGTLNSTCETNRTGYQDEQTWKNWMNLFILWKEAWLQKHGYHQDAPVLLLLDGHYSHLDLEVLFTAVKHRIRVVCMLAHATHLVQPNDKSVNKRFKQNLDEELSKMASNDLVVQNFDLAYLCERALDRENMKEAITSSYRQVGVFPFDRHIVL